MPQLNIAWFLFYFILAWTLIALLWPTITNYNNNTENNNQNQPNINNTTNNNWNW
uniref:ATP synthase F0 subunit 8 n=1 Tax=Colochirus quadrangularis TaxID=1980634 RepID=A0A7G7MWL9_9ECHN|nr:ATP synthase F0 subunit 8 [Colochirus quadrangularis]QNG57228.1 ATP synthase F0 subunit 8 [Colochirus quadrangularis]QQY85576.1 ATP synthase subunit 8 [Colochirus quadrangularis]